MRRGENLLPLLGINSQGDLGPWTMYTDKQKGLVFFIKAPPLEPPSLLQTSVRNAVKLSAYTWRSLSAAQRADWETAARRTHLKIHGYNLFTFWIITKDDPCIHTVERLSKIKLIPLERTL